MSTDNVISIIIFAQIVLFPTEARYSLHVANYNIQELPNEQNRNNEIKVFADMRTC